MLADAAPYPMRLSDGALISGALDVGSQRRTVHVVEKQRRAMACEQSQVRDVPVDLGRSVPAVDRKEVALEVWVPPCEGGNAVIRVARNVLCAMRPAR